ncbi:hypothetical protein F6X40_09860 [Paraburkholderia sp. UCT31]|uniref:hypothetical protein n=1 Tax=Paraburkholderia sp. UCT31 TaxID=2615209 RepID=UPI001654EC85|nr:hypothetical protein [Paraburkholderia sp. UCT31]MBC8737113.1 hypothetical protein [Paraburkholderia sp. UCT31]
MLLDIQVYYAKLANNEALSNEELTALLKELAHFRQATAYLASCQAATAESLPASTSKTARGRHVDLCANAVKLLKVDSSPIRYTQNLEAAQERCEKVVADWSLAHRSEALSTKASRR